MTPSEVTRQDLEALVSKANELAKEMGLTLHLDPSKINLQPGDNVHGNYNEDDNNITLNYDQKGIFDQDLIKILVHEGTHEKFDKEIVPNCKNYITKCYISALFDENLAYAVQFFFDAEIYTQGLGSKNPEVFRQTNCHYPQLGYAIAKACKNGMKMDEIFDKVKTIQLSDDPKYPSAIVAKFIRDDLGIKLTDVFEKENANKYERCIAAEAAQ